MKNTAINISVIKRIAKALRELNQKAIYVGGAVVSLYVNDPGADDVRPTKDLDIALQITSLIELEKLREELLEKGFTQTAEDDVICRFRFDNIKVDVMATHPVGWAPANQWFEPGFANYESIAIGDETIKILSLPYFLASKYTAFKDRGNKDPRTSHDLEDIIYILDNRTDLVEMVVQAPKDVLTFLKTAFSEILEDEVIQEAIIGNLYYETQTERFDMIIKKLKLITGGKQ